ncbi:hypothetical protein D3C84_793180 [compost metagenome]
MTNEDLPAIEVTGMIQHWLATPENGYLGSGYGGKTVVGKVTKKECVEPAVSEVIAKLKEDITYLASRNPAVAWVAEANGRIQLKVSAGTYSELFTL